MQGTECFTGRSLLDNSRPTFSSRTTLILPGGLFEPWRNHVHEASPFPPRSRAA
jgi:hypothetical protein